MQLSLRLPYHIFIPDTSIAITSNPIGLEAMQHRDAVMMMLKGHEIDRSNHAAQTRIIESAEFSNLDVQLWRLEPGRFDPATFESNEIACVITGRTYVDMEVGDTTQHLYLEPGMTCISPLGARQVGSKTFDTIDSLHIFLPTTLIERSALEDYDVDPAKIELSHASGLRDPFLHQMALALRGRMEREIEPPDQLFLDGVQAAIAGHLLGHYTIDRWRPKPSNSVLGFKRLNRVLDLIEERLAEPIALRDLAAEAHLSEFHFSRLFRLTTGLSPYRYVTSRRVQEAQRLLIKTQTSLLDIALETGFGSTGNFLRVFHKYVGLTPGRYRALHRR